MSRAARVRRALPVAALALVAAAALLAPWLGLRDPARQPDSRVLGALPPARPPGASRCATAANAGARRRAVTRPAA